MNPAYNGCTCDCHSHPGVMHFLPCCYPRAEEPNVTDSHFGPYINLDLDGVFADFLGYTRSLGIDYLASPPKAWGQISAIPGFFTKLPVLPGSIELLRALEHHGPRLRFLTALPLPTGHLLTAGADKRHWVRQNLTRNVEVMTVLGGANKYQFARAGDILIDDLERNLEHWVRAGGIGIHHTSVETTLAELRQLGLLRPAASNNRV